MTRRRSRARFKSARAAWLDIEHATGIPASRVKGTAHTRKSFVFVIRDGRRRR